MRGSERVTSRHRVERVLAGAVLAMLPLGPIVTLKLDVGGIGILPSWIVLVLLVGHSAVEAMSGRGPRYPRNIAIRLFLVVAVLLGLPVLVAVSVPSAAAAYLSFILGAVGAVVVGRAWASLPRTRFSAVDAGLVVFLLIGAVQLMQDVSSASTSGTGFHQASETDWGGSNYIAGVLVVGSLILIARIRQSRASRLLYLVAALVIIMALLTYSRGAIVSLGLGAVVFLWNVGRTKFERNAFRLIAIVMPIVFSVLYSSITSARFQNSAQSLRNIDARFLLYRLGWEQFLQDPVLGTGWVSLRPVSDVYLGAPISFAHNVIISFLQIGGLIGFAYLIVLGTLAVMCLRTGNPLSGAVVAGVAISMTDPFFEGYIGGLLTVSAIVLCLTHRALLSREISSGSRNSSSSIGGAKSQRQESARDTDAPHIYLRGGHPEGDIGLSA